MALIAIGSRVAFRLGIFLSLLEVAAWFGDAAPAGRALDTVALVATGFVLWASTHGTALLLAWMQRRHPLGGTDDLW